ncbi:MAG: MBL fold metallo-hydrolase [Desulfobacterales bacterium]|jgi:7,8-dihydropterin-6-yl-methyl-4-(beta-D-ribofuranosyl)aminobenzene 5'-phosphate synthase|nr:MBL fold metallo-hydrolase [Desulfobacterales bacterium]
MISVTCVVANEVAFGSSFRGEHGLAFFIQTPDAAVLFDTGQTPQLLAHNLEAAGIRLEQATHLVLSHGHYDHTGGLPHVLARMERPVLIAASAVFETKLSARHAPPKPIGMPLPREELALRTRLTLRDEPTPIGRYITVTGVIPRESGFETVDPKLLREAGGRVEPDPLHDDQSLVLETGKGLAAVLGCCHSGLINTLRRVRRISPRPIVAVLGGSHLQPAGNAQITATIEALRTEFPSIESFRLNHCTGWKALMALREAFGDKVQPFAAGEKLEFI